MTDTTHVTDKTDTTDLAQRYIALWNESDERRRIDAVAALWTHDAQFVDPVMKGEGREQIARLIAAAHQRFEGLRFALNGPPDGHGDHLRFSWRLGPEGADSLVEGTDFATLRDGRFERVVGFFDKVPAGV